MGIDRYKIHKVTHFVTFEGHTEGPFVTDLHWDEGRWFLVFDWKRGTDGKRPKKRTPVSEDQLEPGGPGFVLREPVPIADRRIGSWLFPEQ